MASALGTDIGGVEDVDLFLSYVDGPRAAAEAAMRGLLHGTNKLWWAPDLGYDVRQNLHGFFDAERIRAAAQTQCETDERIDAADVLVTSFGDELRIAVDLSFTQDPTKVQFTLSVDQIGNVLDVSVSV